MNIISATWHFILSIFFFEKKILFARIKYCSFFLKNIDLFKFIFFIFNKEINPFKSLAFNTFIKKNKKKWINKKINNNEDIILFENFISHVGYTSNNILLTKYLQSIYNCNAYGFLRKGDLKGEIIARSFGIKAFYYYSTGNFLNRVKYILKSLLILKKIKNVKNLINFNINEINIGFLAYDSFMRYTGYPTAKKINPRIILSFAEALNALDYYQKTFSKIRIKYFIQGEKNFIPMGIFFQMFLKDKTHVYSKYGPKKITFRKYTHFNQRQLEKRTISKKLFYEIFNNFKNYSIKLIEKEMTEKSSFGHLPYWNPKKFKYNNSKEEKLLNNQSFYKIFGWNKKKKIATIFLHHLIDGNYRHGKRKIFLDNFNWALQTLNHIKNCKKMNWIIKQHPSEYYYNSKFNFSTYIKKIEKKYPHIRLCPNDLNHTTIKKFTDVAITSHGTSGIEFPAKGINSICVEDSFYTEIGCSIKAKNLKHYKFLLSRAHKLRKIKKEQIKKAKVFMFITEFLTRNEWLVPPHALDRNIEEDKFFKSFLINLKKFKNKNDVFYKMLKKQILYKSRHTINHNIIKLDKELNDYK
jgi:hypothetical protein